MVAVKDLASGQVQAPKHFRIPRSRIVWARAEWGRKNVLLTPARDYPADMPLRHARRVAIGQNTWSVDPQEQVLVWDGALLKWAPMGAANEVAPKAEANHRHWLCGGVVAEEGEHRLRHAKRAAGCEVCDALVREAQAREAKAEGTVKAATLAGPDVAEAVACGHDGLQLARICKKWVGHGERVSAIIGGIEMRALGHGVSRVAIDPGCGKHVIKVEYNNGGAFGGLGAQAKGEVEFFLKANPEQRQDLARIFAWTEDYKGVVVEKAFRDPQDLLAALRQRARAMGIGDLHGNNVGYRADGHPVVLDFGL